MSNSTVRKVDTAMDVIQRRLDIQILTRGRVVFIGLGGIGSPLVENLAIFCAGLSSGIPIRMVLCDGDAFTPENTYRVNVPAFTNKAVAWAAELSERLCVPGLSVRPVPNYVTGANRSDIIRNGDCVLLCVDNHATRRLVSNRVGQLRDAVLISGGNDGVNDRQSGTYGNVQVYVRAAGRDVHGAPLERFHPEIAHPTDKNPDELDCLALAAGGEPQLGLANLACASLMAAALLRLMMPATSERMYDEVCFDIHQAIASPRWLTGPRRLPEALATRGPARSRNHSRANRRRSAR